MYEVIIKRGNAVEPYVEIERQVFHTELAAQLWGSGNCKDDPYKYWTYRAYPD